MTTSNNIAPAAGNHRPALWRRIPFLRWSFWRMAFGMRNLTTNWQVGDGREARLADYVETHAQRGNAADVVRVIDQYCYRESVLINVGDEKGAILDAALARARAGLVLELGTYCGYSALRMAVAVSTARIVSIEYNPDNADIARRILAHAGVTGRVTVVTGTLGDGGATAQQLEAAHGFSPGAVDFVFLDHHKDNYLPDLALILARGWLRPEAVVVADNVRFPGAPEYRAHMQQEEGKTWRTVEHPAHVEYQSVIKDLVLESVWLGGK